MKMNKLAAAVAASCAMAMGTAHALTPDAPIAITLHMSGASAEDYALRLLFTTDLCVSGTADEYLSNGNGNDFSAISCQLDNSKLVDAASLPAGFPTNPNVILVKRSNGGSGMGVQPVAEARAITNMVVNSSNCTDTGTTDPELGIEVYSCNTTINADGSPGAGTAAIVSDAGLSDVEPGMFVGPNVPPGSSDVTPADLNNLNVASATAVVFGVPVSLNLRNALQAAEGLTVGSETEADMPSLSSRQIAALETGGITNWNQLMVGSTGLPSVSGVTPPASGSTLVHICRRVPGSGTQAQFNANFLRSPCTPGALPSVLTSGLFGPIVTQNAGAGGLGDCLSNESKAGNWAIGLQSTEKNTSHSKDYRFIKVDGYAPTLQNVMATNYFDWSANSMQWRKTLDNGTDVNCANTTDCSNKLEVLKTIRKKVAGPAIIKALNTKFQYSWGQGGYLALSTNATPPADGQYDPNNPTINQTKTVSSPDTCRISHVISASQLPQAPF